MPAEDLHRAGEWRLLCRSLYADALCQDICMFLSFQDAEYAYPGLERMMEQGTPVAPYIRSGSRPITKSCLLQGAPGGAALSMRRAACAA